MRTTVAAGADPHAERRPRPAPARRAARRARPSGTSSRSAARCAGCTPASPGPGTARSRSTSRSDRPTARAAGRRTSTTPGRGACAAASIAARSRGERIRPSSCARSVHRAGEERALADVPDPPAAFVEAPPRRAGTGAERLERGGRGIGSVGHRERRAVGPVVAELRVEAHAARPRRRATSRPAPAPRRTRWGRVSSDGPTSNVAPAWRTDASFPPVTALRSRTSTRWPAAARRMATASPPTPAPTTTTSRSATGHPRRRRAAAIGSIAAPADERRPAGRRRRRAKPTVSITPMTAYSATSAASGSVARQRPARARPSRASPVTNQPAKLMSGMPR